MPDKETFTKKEIQQAVMDYGRGCTEGKHDFLKKIGAELLPEMAGTYEVTLKVTVNKDNLVEYQIFTEDQFKKALASRLTVAWLQPTTRRQMRTMPNFSAANIKIKKVAGPKKVADTIKKAPVKKAAKRPAKKAVRKAR